MKTEQAISGTCAAIYKVMELHWCLCVRGRCVPNLNKNLYFAYFYRRWLFFLSRWSREPLGWPHQVSPEGVGRPDEGGGRDADHLQTGQRRGKHQGSVLATNHLTCCYGSRYIFFIGLCGTCCGTVAQSIERPSKGPRSVQLDWREVGTNPSAAAQGGWKKILAVPSGDEAPNYVHGLGM